ncbi:hypothetical protein AB0F44_16830 [Nocardioides sp. NPDC023903]|uniref:hypothetical protein n=1 Tax=Nocardioides sp. NPDC023903 TaxID=3157195 RepID=UPI0033DFA8D1
MLRTPRSSGRSLHGRMIRAWRSAWETPATTAVRAINVNLVVVFAFALAALVFLTRAAVSTAQLNDSVEAAINLETSGMAHDTRLVGKLDHTVAGTSEIARTVEPLAGHLSKTVVALHSLRGDLATTDDSVANIERSARGIDKSVANMRRPVGRLHDGVGDIRSHSGSMTTSLSGTADLTAAMERDIASSNTALARIRGTVDDLHPVVDGIGSDLDAIGVHTQRIENNGIIRLGNVLQSILNGLLGQP